MMAAVFHQNTANPLLNPEIVGLVLDHLLMAASSALVLCLSIKRDPKLSSGGGAIVLLLNP
jgi:hypothetical protein